MAEESQGAESADTVETSSVSDTEKTPNTFLNAFIGGIIGVVLSFIPFSTVLGGGVAGYLEGGEYGDGAKVGALAGLVALVPFVFILAVGLAVVPVVSAPGAGVQFALWVSVLLIGLVAAIYTIGFSLLGGILGVYLKNEL